MLIKIMVDPEIMEAAAQRMDAQTAEYESQYKQLFNEVDRLGTVWEGDDYIAFAAQIKGFADDCQSMVKLMKSYSDFLRQSARIYRDAQGEITDGARRLSH